MSTKGTITQVLGAVVDVQFPSDKVPEIYNAIQIDYKVEGKATRLILEVQQHLGNGLVRAVAMTTTEGLVRGGEAVDTGAPITVPVGNGVLGRIFNVTGDAVDERGPVEHSKRYPIHRLPPPLTEQSTSAELLGTGISHCGHPTRKIAAGAVIVAAPAAHQRARGIVCIGPRSFGEHPHMGSIASAVRSAGAADNVIVKHGLDRPALITGIVCQQLSTIEPLLLARKQSIDHAGGIALQRQHPRRFQHQRRAGTVIVGPRRIAGRVHHIGDAAVDMAGDDDHPAGVTGPLLDRQDVHHLSRIGHPTTGDHLRRGFDGQAAAAVLADGLKARLHPAAGGADAARAAQADMLIAVGAGSVIQGTRVVAGATQHQCPNCSYLYDAAKGCPEEGYPAGTSWLALPESFTCPRCAVRDKPDFISVA